MDNTNSQNQRLQYLLMALIVYIIAGCALLIYALVTLVETFDGIVLLWSSGLIITLLIVIITQLPPRSRKQELPRKSAYYAIVILGAVIGSVLLISLAGYVTVSLKYPGSACEVDGKVGVCQHGFTELSQAEYQEKVDAKRFLSRSYISIVLLVYILSPSAIYRLE